MDTWDTFNQNLICPHCLKTPTIQRFTKCYECKDNICRDCRPPVDVYICPAKIKVEYTLEQYIEFEKRRLFTKTDKSAATKTSKPISLKHDKAHTWDALLKSPDY